ncbi:nucleoside diphosphate kinase 6 isoform X3 [Saccopteryx leptura]|uniref:nucleoside diphosphate kinase 6 isoform X3 n=1 Tax=Saccopteryx leptura TaxID=249018 RepID=UPI00339BC8B9
MASVLRSPQALQLTLALIKPDAVAHPLILEAVHQQILSNKFLIVRMRELVWRKEDCQRFYQEHEGGRSMEVSLGHQCLDEGTLSLQGDFSISGWWSSWPDSVTSARREIAAFFPDFSEQRWYEEEEPQLRGGPVRSSLDGGVHCAA